MAKPVTIRILGDASNLEKALGGVNDKLGKFGKVAGAAVAGAAAGVAAFGVSSIGKFTEFETGMAEVFTLMPGMSEEAMSAMEQQVLDLSNQMGILPGDAIPALYDAISAGVPTDNVFQFMEDASKLAIGGSIETSEAVDVLSTSVNAWSESNLSAADAGDYLFTTVKLGKTTMAELNSSLSQVAPTAAALGVGLDEVGASLAVLTAGGMPTAQAATAMNAAIAELGKSGTNAATAFAELNDGQTFNELIESGGSFEDAMVLIADSGEPVLDMFSSLDAAKGVLALTAGGAEALSANMDAMAGSSGAAGEAFATMDGTTGRAVERVKAKLATLQVQVGEKLMPVVERLIAFIEEHWPKISEVMMPVIDAVTEGVRMFADVLKGGEGDDSFISKFAVYLRDIVWPLIVDIKDWIVDNWPTISAVFSAVFGFIVEEVLPRVIEAIRFVAEVIGVVVGYIVEHWPEISAVIQTVIDFVVDEVLPRIVSAFEWIQEAVQVFIEAFQRFWSAWGDTITESLTKAWDAIKGIVAGALDYLKGVFDFWKALFTGDWGAMWDAIVDQVSGLWTLLKGAFLLGWEAVKLSFKMVWESIKIMASAAFGKIVDGIKALPGLMWEGLKAGGQLLLDAGSWMGDKIMEGLVAALKFVGQTLWDMLPGPVQWGLEHGAGAVGGFIGDVGGLFGIGGGGDDEPEYTLADFANPDSPAYTMMGGGGYDYRPQARGGGTNNITVNTSTNATPSEITDAVVWGLQVSGVN